MDDMGIDRGFWNNRSVFITGHTGFKGGWLSLWLQEIGAKVTGYALQPETDPNFFHAVGIERSMTSIIGDVLDFENLYSRMKDAEPSIAFHLAAQPLVQKSYDDPVGTFAVNVIGTVNFLEAVRKIPSIKAAVVVTSDKCYSQDDTKGSFKEDDPLGGPDPYSSSKGCAELVVKSYRESFFNDRRCGIATARAGNVIGGGDWAANRLIPDLVRAISEKKKLDLRYPNAVRPWQHVLEPLSGYMQLAERLWRCSGDYARGWNFGPTENPRTVLEVVRSAKEILGGDLQFGGAEKLKNKEATYLSIDSALVQEMLGWKTKLNFETMLQWTFLWYHNYYHKTYNIRQYSLQQIHQYSKMSEMASIEPCHIN